MISKRRQTARVIIIEGTADIVLPAVDLALSATADAALGPLFSRWDLGRDDRFGLVLEVLPTVERPKRDRDWEQRQRRRRK